MKLNANYSRRTAMKVKNGQVQRSNNHVPTTHLGYVIDREAPGHGFRHVLTKRDLHDFTEIIPDWNQLSRKLERIVLARPSRDAEGEYAFYHREETSAIYLHAWQEDLWVELTEGYFDSHRLVFNKLGVNYDSMTQKVLCRFTEAQAKAFMLLHIFLHELGHHHDRLNQKHRNGSRGEDYAERFANNRLDQLFPAYVAAFGDPRRGC